MAPELICLSSLKLHPASRNLWPATSSDRSVVLSVTTHGHMLQLFIQSGLI